MPADSLAGLRVVDFGQTMAGPLLCGMLADLGAEVIKVETRRRPDSLRLSPENRQRDVETDPVFHSQNRNKLGITVDFSTAEGVDLLKKLVSVSDVVVENFSPHVMANHGLDYAALREVNPSIVMISMPSAGMSGPLVDLVTYGPTLTCFSGVESLVGYPGERVLGTWFAFGDDTAAIMGTFGVLAALHHRRKTGQGQHIELAQLEATVALLGEALMDYTMNGRVLGTQGNRHAYMAPHNNYRCRGEDSWVSIAVAGEVEWDSFCVAIGNPEWTQDARFADGYSRYQNQELLNRYVTEWTMTHTAYEATGILQAAGVAAMPCLSTAERFDDPHLKERHVYLELEHPATGKDWTCNTPFKMSATPPGIRRPAPRMGEHNAYVFVELLGMAPDDVAKLEERGILA